MSYLLFYARVFCCFTQKLEVVPACDVRLFRHVRSNWTDLARTDIVEAPAAWPDRRPGRVSRRSKEARKEPWGAVKSGNEP